MIYDVIVHYYNCSFVFIFFSSSLHSGSAMGRILILGVIPMCKDCARTNCRDKNKPPAKCERFLRYEDSKRFETFDHMMRENKGIVLDK